MKKFFAFIIASCCIALLPQICFAQPGALDTTFNPAFGLFTEGLLSPISFFNVSQKSIQQPDGKIIIAEGLGSNFNGAPLNKAIIRLNKYGTLDAGFNAVGQVQGDNPFIQALALQGDGKIIVGGNFLTYSGIAHHNIFRLNANGSLDNSFVTGAFQLSSFPTLNSYVNSITVQPDGKLIIAGNFSHYGGVERKGILRLNTDGSLDNNFNPGTSIDYHNQLPFVRYSALQSDGKIIISGFQTTDFGINVEGIARLNTDGTFDNTFTPPSASSFNHWLMTQLIVSPDDKMIIGGHFVNNGGSYGSVMRLNADGSSDNSFTVGSCSGYTNNILDIKVQADGKIIIGGTFDTYALSPTYTQVTVTGGMLRLLTDGTIDPGFTTGHGINLNSSNGGVSIIQIQSSQKIFTGIAAANNFYLKRLKVDGSLDVPNTSILNASMNHLALQSDGKIIVSGLYNYMGTARNGIARINTDGSIDENFDPSATWLRYQTEGNPPAFNSITSIGVQPDDKIVIWGNRTYTSISQNASGRANPDGTQDLSFTPRSFGDVGGFTTSPTFTVVQADGKILIGLYYSSNVYYDGVPINGIARLNNDGSHDNSFSTGTGIYLNASSNSGYVNSIALQPDGKIIIGGSFDTYNGIAINKIARLNADGSLDGSFVPPVFSGDGFIKDVKLQPDGKILIGGEGYFNYNGVQRTAVARLNADGSIDESFIVPAIPQGTSGEFAIVNTISLQSDGKIILGGLFNCYNTDPERPKNNLIRLNNDGSVDYTFNQGRTGFPEFLTTNAIAIRTSAIQPDGKLLIGGEANSFNPVYNNTPIYTIARILTAPCENPVAPSLNISASPSTNVCTGSSVTFTASPTNGGSTPAYQWRKNGVNVGSNSATYTDAAIEQGDIITCRLKSDLPCAIPDSAISNSLSMSVSVPVTPSISIALTSGTLGACQGETFSFVATPGNEGSNPTYQWKINGNNAGSNSPTFMYSNFFDGDLLTCTLTNNDGCASPPTAFSNGISISIEYPRSWYLDNDHDMYGTGLPVVSCASPGGNYTALLSGDCDDDNATVNPGAVEIYGNNIDDNCNSEIDELPYCTPAITFLCSSDGIDEVILGSITNNTNGVACSNGYFNYTLSHSTSNAAGSTVNFSIALRSFSLQQVNVYVDYTNDGDFDDAGEAVAVGVEGFEGAPATGSFVIPASQPVGNYRVRVISNSSFQFAFDACNSTSGEAEDYKLIVTPFVKPPYCTPVVDFPCVYTWMQDVTLGTIVNNNSSCNGGYSDFSSLSTDVLPGGNVDFSINCFGGFNQYANIYVDFTDDGDFDDAGEQVITNFLINANATATGSFAVPAPLPGGNYRLRIVMDEENNPSPTACHSSVGEAEDYTLHVLPVYCIPVIDNPCSNSYIAIVSIGSINNVTTCNGYDDYSTTQSTAAAQGTLLNFSITSPYFIDQNASIYIDYNSNGDFTDAGEQVAANLYMNDYSTPATGTFQIPPTQAPGSYRMRVVSDMTGNNTEPCHSVFGEAEDYTLIVESSCPVNTWTSAAHDGDWSNPANWCTGAVPTGAGNATIPAANAPYPALTADASVNNIVIEAGATLSIGAHTLTLNGTVNEATFGSGGTISGSDQSSLVALNNAATYLYFTPGQNVLKHLTLGYAAQLFVYSGDLEITANPIPGKLTLGQYSNFYCSNLIFKSGPAGTVRLDELPVDGSGNAEVQIQGSQTIERYIPNNNFRSWRLLSVPTHGSGQTIRQAWQEGDANPSPQQNNLPGYGTQITGTGSLATAQAAGFDNAGANAAMLYWNTNAWNPVTNTNTAIDNKKAYFLYVRGERSKGVSGAVTNSSATTLRTTGSLYTGDQNTIVPANNFTVVPNLYASAIDFTGLTRTGVANLFYVWDSKKLNGSSLGVYQTFSATNGFNCMVSGGSYILGQPNTLIESGQAFFVQGNSTGGSIVLHESSKRNGSTGLGFRPSPHYVSKLETRLYDADGITMRDANTIVFNAAYKNRIEEEDAPKFGNPGENFSVETDSRILAVEGRQPLKDSDVIQFRMWNLKHQQYILELAPLNIDTEGLAAMLEDGYLKTFTTVDLTKASTYSFVVSADTGSYAANRFRIIFSKTKTGVSDTKQEYCIAPNPVESGIVNVQFKNQPKGKYNVRIISATGQVLAVKEIAHVGGSALHTIALPAAVAQGYYKVEIIATGKSKEVINIIVNKK